MIAHVVLFRPRADLAPEVIDALIAAFERALGGIDAIRRAHVGRRLLIGRGYEELMKADFSYAAILEFDDAEGLRSYLGHPAHAELGAAIFDASAELLIYDFAMVSGADGIRSVAVRP